MPVSRTDDELDALYKAENGVSHAAALRSLYQAGRADEAEVQADQVAHVKTANANLQNQPKRAIKDPGAAPAPLLGDGSDPAPAVDPPVLQDEVAYTDSGPTTKPVKGAKTNIPNTPNPGTDPPGLEHPSANAGG